jgi:hypothetical protein
MDKAQQHEAIFKFMIDNSEKYGVSEDEKESWLDYFATNFPDPPSGEVSESYVNQMFEPTRQAVVEDINSRNFWRSGRFWRSDESAAFVDYLRTALTIKDLIFFQRQATNKTEKKTKAKKMYKEWKEAMDKDREHHAKIVDDMPEVNETHTNNFDTAMWFLGCWGN